jgi:hypothetical protein
MKNNAKVVVCTKHDDLYNTVPEGYEYDSNLHDECPLCWLFAADHPAKEDDQVVMEKFQLKVEIGDLVEVWFANSGFAVGLTAALKQINPEVEEKTSAVQFAFDAVVLAYATSSYDDPEPRYDPGFEFMLIRTLTGSVFCAERVTWPTGRMEFAGPFPEDEEWALYTVPEGAEYNEDGIPAETCWTSKSIASVRIYKKEVKEN